MPDMLCSFIRLPWLLLLPIEPLCDEEPLPLHDDSLPVPPILLWLDPMLPVLLVEEEPMLPRSELPVPL